VVIYLVNPFNHADAIVDLCAAYLALYYAYAATPAYEEAERHELMLQIVPVHLVLSDRTLPVVTRSELVKLALSVYERCMLISGKGKHYGGGVASSVMLVPPLPTRIHFALSPDPPRSLLDDHRCLHIAYSCSMDDRWVSVAWSDSLGGMQTLASFCLTISGGGGMTASSSRSRRPFWEVAREVWERSVELVCAQRERVSWRFLLVRNGVMEQHEIDGTSSSPNP
jgi:mediator of RNA polymerase II transcription subunit 13